MTTLSLWFCKKNIILDFKSVKVYKLKLLGTFSLQIFDEVKSQQ